MVRLQAQPTCDIEHSFKHSVEGVGARDKRATGTIHTWQWKRAERCPGSDRNRAAKDDGVRTR